MGAMARNDSFPSAPALDLAAGLLAVASLLFTACGGEDGGSGGSGGTSTGTTTSSSSSTGGEGGSGATGGGAAGGSGGEAPVMALVHRAGRFDDTDPTGPVSSWSYSGFHTRIDGSELSVVLGGASGIYFEVAVDGQPSSVFQTSGGQQSYTLTTNLPAGEHDIAVYRRNEGFFGNVQLLGIEPGAGTTQIESPRPFAHRIEFVGDSITCGYGVEGPDENCNFSGATESATITYAAIASRTLNAEAHLIAYSGKGVYQNYGGDLNELMPELYLRTLTNDAASSWDFSSWTPEAVVVNLGTNDFSAAISEGQFVPAYVALLATIRGHYPEAAIFCVTWAHWGATHESWVQSAMTQSGDANVHHVGFSIDPNDGWGCDWHPSAVTHQKLGDLLATTMAAELGW